MPLSVLLRVALTQVSLFIKIVQDQKYITVTVVFDSISSHILGHQLLPLTSDFGSEVGKMFQLLFACYRPFNYLPQDHNVQKEHQ